MTRHGTFEACKTKDAAPESINYAVHERMTECEVRIAEAARRSGDELIVLDGPLRKGQHIRDAIGFVKTHHVRYLPEHLNPVVGALAAGERTPLFRIDARPFSRTTWYVRLPGPAGGPWAGIVRCEASGTLPLGTRRRARRHRDRRAPPVRVRSPTRTLAPPRTWHRSARSSGCCAIGSATRRCAIARSVPRAARALFRRLDRSGRLARTLLELLIERAAVIDQAIPPAVSETAEELLEIAKDAIEGVRDWASDTAERARDAVTPPKKKKRSKLPLLLVLLGLGALAFYILRKRGEAADTLIAGDFDAGRRRGPRRHQRRARPAVDTRHLTRHPAGQSIRTAPRRGAVLVAALRGGDGNRTRVQGFADLCLSHSATPPERISVPCDPTNGSGDDDSTAGSRRGRAAAGGWRRLTSPRRGAARADAAPRPSAHPTKTC